MQYGFDHIFAMFKKCRGAATARLVLNKGKSAKTRRNHGSEQSATFQTFIHKTTCGINALHLGM